MASGFSMGCPIRAPAWFEQGCVLSCTMSSMEGEVEHNRALCVDMGRSFRFSLASSCLLLRPHPLPVLDPLDWLFSLLRVPESQHDSVRYPVEPSPQTPATLEIPIIISINYSITTAMLVTSRDEGNSIHDHFHRVSFSKIFRFCPGKPCSTLLLSCKIIWTSRTRTTLSCKRAPLGAGIGNVGKPGASIISTRFWGLSCHTLIISPGDGGIWVLLFRVLC